RSGGFDAAGYSHQTTDSRRRVHRINRKETARIMRPYIAQITSNLRLMARDRTVLFFSYLFPLTFFFLFAQVFDASKSPAAMAQVISMVVIIGVLGTGFFGAGMR